MPEDIIDPRCRAPVTGKGTEANATRRQALLKLGLGTAIAYTAPSLIRLDRAQAKGNPSCHGGGHAKPSGHGGGDDGGGDGCGGD